MARKPSKPQDPSNSIPEATPEVAPKTTEASPESIQQPPKRNTRDVTMLPHGAIIENF